MIKNEKSIFQKKKRRKNRLQGKKKSAYVWKTKTCN